MIFPTIVCMDNNEIENNGTDVRNINRTLRTGHTTGSCAAAATKAAISMLFNQKNVDAVELMTPKGVLLKLNIENGKFTKERASCAVRKDGGDDPDCTHGTLVYADVSLTSSGISIDGGKGVGRVTKGGLDQPIGNAAINSTPRKMISSAVKEVCQAHGYEGGVSVVISVPEGETIAMNTFNPRLGIVGGISIIGTSGIVEPMSEKAMIDTTYLEMRVRRMSGSEYLLIVPGNYGKEFVKSYPLLKDEYAIKCSNFIGEALDSAVELNAKGVLLVGNLGKMVKVAGGIMNTHSKHGDRRMEILASAVTRAGMSAEISSSILGCNTTDDALDLIGGESMQDVMDVLIRWISASMNDRVNRKIEVGAIVFSSKYGKLCSTENADTLAKMIGDGL
jgi:cobalt-precorrin-5B (C1)-methyltransferase